MPKTNATVDLTDLYERIPVKICPDAVSGSAFLAQEIAMLIKAKQAKGEKCVLGLATGSSPKKLYAELVRLHKQEGLSFKNVVTFNLDEYYPIVKSAAQSYDHFMRTHLFNHIDIDPKNIHIPNGEIAKDQIKEYCAAYEQEIEKAGGLDLQILGIGSNGHIGFNEPGSHEHSKTRMVALENSTRLANAGDFPNIAEMPRQAITMGIQTILRSRRILLMAWGSGKAGIVQQAVEGPVSNQVPASVLQLHDHTLFVIDNAAAAELTRHKAPWLIGGFSWTPATIRKAVVQMALKLGKPILSLTNKDYRENGLSELLHEKGNAYEINLLVYYMLRDTITGWPGGKPKANLPNHPERSEPYPKRILIFSPHPDDDIISMGGTFQRLHDQGHEVHVAYQTSGNIAVTDEFVTRFMDFAVGFEELFKIDSQQSKKILEQARQYLQSKKTNEVDSPEIRAVKGLIRRSEAAATCRYVGLKENQFHFQNLPFYETGTIEKKPMGAEDVKQTVELLKKIKPHQVFCAGDFADPHGTHLVCFNIVMEALKQCKGSKEAWINDCWLWLYKGAWQEWDITEIQMAVPMSPEQVLKKRFGIFIHQSQKDMVPFQGTDTREFWQRAEERNSNTANLYGRLGLTQYAAMEAFVRWDY